MVPFVGIVFFWVILRKLKNFRRSREMFDIDKITTLNWIFETTLPVVRSLVNTSKIVDKLSRIPGNRMVFYCHFFYPASCERSLGVATKTFDAFPKRMREKMDYQYHKVRDIGRPLSSHSLRGEGTNVYPDRYCPNSRVRPR